MFYDFLGAANADQMLDQYHLSENKRYRYLADDTYDEQKQPKSYVRNFNKLLACMKDTLEFTDSQLNTIWRVLAAILNIGELSFSEDDDGETKFENVELITKSEYLCSFVGDIEKWPITATFLFFFVKYHRDDINRREIVLLEIDLKRC